MRKDNETISFDEAAKMQGDIVIPDSMDRIPEWLFDRNSRITSVVVPGTVKSIGSRAFADCDALESVTLNEGIEEIEACVFTGCKKLKKVVYPDSVKKYQGWTFYDTDLDEPVMNVSETILVFCPRLVSGRKWTVPATVKTIAWQAFIEHSDLEYIDLPEGLEVIEGMSFIRCGLKEITIPFSVRKIEANAFWRCADLKKVCILNPDTQIDEGAFDANGNVEIIVEKDMRSDRYFHILGKPFLIQRSDVSANLDHCSDNEFDVLVKRCAEGDADGMYAMAEFFCRWSSKKDASPFYVCAANYWRYRAFCKGNDEAAKWFENFFAEHPHEQLESVISESCIGNVNYYNYSLSGKLLNDLGYSFFEPEKLYEVKVFQNEGYVEVSAFDSYEGPDEDGFGEEYYYKWWFLDEIFRPIPEFSPVIATSRDKADKRFKEMQAKAAKHSNIRRIV